MSQISKRERRASFKSDFYDTYVKLIDFIEVLLAHTANQSENSRQDTVGSANLHRRL